ncbi:MAG: hypothetical protein L0196_07505 [candidate division Zixibacteria bacterium]|nr:hypothetical protein [candidate division Zixibacteria bacterium]
MSWIQPVGNIRAIPYKVHYYKEKCVYSAIVIAVSTTAVILTRRDAIGSIIIEVGEIY